MSDQSGIEAHSDALKRLRAAFAFAEKVTVALALERNGDLSCVGTGTLFEIAKRHFIITASHVCEGDLGGLFIPANGDLDERISCDENPPACPSDPGIDVASIELTDLAIHELIIRGYRFLDLGQVDLIGPADPGYIFGYPAVRYPYDRTRRVGWVALGLQRIKCPTDLNPPAIEGLDFCYEYGMNGYRLESEKWRETRMPELNGMSGASVWLMLPSEGAWEPMRSFLVSGVQVAYDHSQYARVHSWWAVVRLLSLQGDDLADILSIKTGIRAEELTRRTGPVA